MAGSLFKKQAAWPEHYDFTELARAADLRRLTTLLVDRFTEFASLEDYLERLLHHGLAACARLTVPASLITALDDPIIPVAGLERLAHPPALKIIVTRRGGHCGFLEDLGAAELG